ncbi:MAG: hypothetical protein ACJ789_07500 [Thermomicrobiales bacterium]
MRTSAMAAILVIFIAGAVIFTGQGLTRGTQANAPIATPESVRVGVATVMGATDQFEMLVRITLPPGSIIPDTTDHKGPSVLYVETGAICYSLLSTGTGVVTVERAPAGASATPTASETETASECVTTPLGGADHDIVADNGTVLLNEGDSVNQSIAVADSVSRGYATVGDDEAIVLIATLALKDTVEAGCGGDCY